MSDTPDLFTLTMTLRAGYGEPPRYLDVIVDGEIWRFTEEGWAMWHHWGFEPRCFTPDTLWVQVPKPIMPIPRDVWAEIGGRWWACAVGIAVTPEAPTVKPGQDEWFKMTPAERERLAATIAAPPGAAYPLDVRFGGWYAPVLRAGDRHTEIKTSPSANDPSACAVWKDGRLIAIVMPVDPRDKVEPTLGEILRGAEVPNG